MQILCPKVLVYTKGPADPAQIRSSCIWRMKSSLVLASVYLQLESHDLINARNIVQI